MYRAEALPGVLFDILLDVCRIRNTQQRCPFTEVGSERPSGWWRRCGSSDKVNTAFTVGIKSLRFFGLFIDV